MKVIVSGSTGTIGGATLRQLAARSEVTSVVALSRREVDDIKDPKVEVLIVSDFTRYDDATLSKLAGAEACVWVLGTPTGGKDVHDGFTFAAAEAFAKALVPDLRAKGKEFRSIYTSGGFVERDTDRTLWFLAETRRMRGLVEKKIAEHQTKHAPTWQTFIARPLLVTQGDPLTLRYLASAWYIPRDTLGAALADVAVDGSGGLQVMDNTFLKEKGQQVLAR